MGGGTNPSDSKWMDPLLGLAWASSGGPSLQIGTAVLVAPLRHPVLLAKQVSTLDVLTGGRVILGLGGGWMKEEAAVLNTSFENRRSRLQEMIDLMHHLWTGENANFHGLDWTVTDARMHPTPVRRRVTIALGGHSPEAIRRAALVADAWLPHAGFPEQLRAESARSGRDSVDHAIRARLSAHARNARHPSETWRRSRDSRYAGQQRRSFGVHRCDASLGRNYSAKASICTGSGGIVVEHGSNTAGAS